jgi:glycosyltransferase involved in cell wall biosynthesis
MRSHDPRKALGVLVEAIAGLEGVTLVLAGQRGEAADMVAAHAARAGVPAVFTGYVPDQALAALMRGAAAVVLPSLHEGFGLPALEAMACGAPLVASRAGNLPGLVGEAGVLVEPGDPAGLAQALRAVLDDAALAARLREAGPRRAEPYSWRRTAEATVAVYHRALER